jgi:hypothetical protein
MARSYRLALQAAAWGRSVGGEPFSELCGIEVVTPGGDDSVVNLKDARDSQAVVLAPDLT